MQKELLEILVNPYTGNRLEIAQDFLVDQVTKERFPVQNGIPAVFRQDKISGLNRVYQKRYDWMCYFYDFISSAMGPFFGIKDVFKGIAEIMDVKSTDRVLETSIGTGKQVGNLLNHGKRASFFGLDISRGMLRKCQRNARKWNIDLGLVQVMRKPFLLRIRPSTWYST